MTGQKMTIAFDNVLDARVEAAKELPLLASVTVLDALAYDLWDRAQNEMVGSPYQSPAFAEAYLSAESTDYKYSCSLLAVYDSTSQPILIWPFHLRLVGPWRVACSIGRNHANFSLPLFDPSAHERYLPSQLRRAVEDAAFAADIDLIYMPHAPAHWMGHANPLLDLENRLSINTARQAILTRDARSMLRTLRGKDSLKRMASKRRKLSELGTLTMRRAHNGADKRSLLADYRRLKDQWSASRLIRNEFSDRKTTVFYESLVDCSNFNVWIIAIDGEVIGLCGGLLRDNHFSLAIIASEQKRFASYTTGDILIEFVITELCNMGVASVDFGTGDAEYKRRWLPLSLPLVDIVHPVTVAGQVGAAAIIAGHKLKAAVKSRPHLSKLVQRARLGKGN